MPHQEWSIISDSTVIGGSQYCLKLDCHLGTQQTSVTATMTSRRYLDSLAAKNTKSYLQQELDLEAYQLQHRVTEDGTR
jgi:hypothetical protein